MEGVPFANGAPNVTGDLPVMQQLSRDNSASNCGKDYKTGQTLIKTILAPGFKARMIGLNGWFSTNILGNRDGEVLEDPGSFKTKEESKTSPSPLPKILLENHPFRHRKPPPLNSIHH